MAVLCNAVQWSRHARLPAVAWRQQLASRNQNTTQLSLRSGDRSMSVSGSDCDCENMTSSLREQKISEFFRSVFLRHANSEGVVSLDSLGPALASLGRSVPTERLARIRRKLDKDGTGVISLKDPEFILTVFSLNVTDVGAIKDDVLTSAFKIFDMVRIYNFMIT